MGCVLHKQFDSRFTEQLSKCKAEDNRRPVIKLDLLKIIELIIKLILSIDQYNLEDDTEPMYCIGASENPTLCFFQI